MIGRDEPWVVVRVEEGSVSIPFELACRGAYVLVFGRDESVASPVAEAVWNAGGTVMVVLDGACNPTFEGRCEGRARIGY